MEAFNVLHPNKYLKVVCLSFAVFKKDCSPGPGYFIEPRITKHGVDGTPSYSVSGRIKDPSELIYTALIRIWDQAQLK